MLSLLWIGEIETQWLEIEKTCLSTVCEHQDLSCLAVICMFRMITVDVKTWRILNTSLK